MRKTGTEDRHLRLIGSSDSETARDHGLRIENSRTTLSYHKDGPVCSGCELKLTTAHPFLGKWFHRVKEKWPNTHISCAYRGQVEQDQCVLDGKSKLKWPNSEHNHTDLGKPCSYALDIFQIDEDGVARWTPVFFVQVNQSNMYAQEPILWGGRWNTLGDKNHFSLDPGKRAIWLAHTVIP